MAQLYAIHRHRFGNKVCMLYTDTDLFLLVFCYDLAKDINTRVHV